MDHRDTVSERGANVSRRLEEEITQADETEHIHPQTFPQDDPVELDDDNTTTKNPPTQPNTIKNKGEPEKRNYRYFYTPPSKQQVITTEDTSTPNLGAVSKYRQRQSNTEREIKLLESHNPPGTRDLNDKIKPTRSRIPSLIKARSTYKDQRDRIKDNLEEFFEQNFESLDKNTLPDTDLNDRYKAIWSRRAALECLAEDFIKVLEIQGLTLERKGVEKELQDIQAQVTGIKLRYPDFISEMSTIYETRQSFRDNLQLNLVRIDEQLNVEPDYPPEKTQHNLGLPCTDNIAEIPTCASQILSPNTLGRINQRQGQLEGIITTGIRTTTSPTRYICRWYKPKNSDCTRNK